jgi:hypothetical protein
MKYTLILICAIWVNMVSAQQNDLSKYQPVFDTSLNRWLQTFGNCSLSNFLIKDTLSFDNTEQEDFNNYNSFLATYKPLLYYDSRGSSFVDIYSYLLNLHKKGNVYYASPSHEQAVYLCIPGKKYWNRIYFTSEQIWIEEAAWISATTFILAGAEQCVENKRSPMVFLCDMVSNKIIRYSIPGHGCCMASHQYKSLLLKKVFIKGL